MEQTTIVKCMVVGTLVYLFFVYPAVMAFLLG